MTSFNISCSQISTNWEISVCIIINVCMSCMLKAYIMFLCSVVHWQLAVAPGNGSEKLTYIWIELHQSRDWYLNSQIPVPGFTSDTSSLWGFDVAFRYGEADNESHTPCKKTNSTCFQGSNVFHFSVGLPSSSAEYCCKLSYHWASMMQVQGCSAVWHTSVCAIHSTIR